MVEQAILQVVQEVTQEYISEIRRWVEQDDLLPPGQFFK